MATDKRSEALTAAGAILLLSSLIALLIQPPLQILLLLWRSLLAVVALILILQALRLNTRNAAVVYLDALIVIAAEIFLLISPPDLLISPSNLGASFSYRLLAPSAAFIAGVLILKDAINMLYGFGAKAREVLAFTLIRGSAVLAVLILGGIFSVILYNGIGAISVEFLTEPHRNLGQEGGIVTCIEGTMWLVLGAMLVSAPLGIGAGIYLNEYSRSHTLNRMITISISCLNGVPSVVYGLFGLAFLVSTVGISLLAGSVILGLMNLPTIILTTQEALRAVPDSLREGSVALGATKWQTILRIVIPSALPGILTGLIIGVSRAAGETAPIMWTAVTFTPVYVNKAYGIVPDVYQPVNNLCYHLLQLIYFLGAWDVEKRAWGTALVLMGLVLAMNSLAIIVRNHYRKKIRW
ncbi:MAG: phosphate ABC transporter permease PstA [Methanothrix sp.]|uniref:phosphate ABC transporter permease PstA n=1 Tax=Methanothrix sp. TaxID=90426 RepID=UPI0025FE3585|nr:phosphate ABC transporter permease PstA [Methanothrix sp.]MCQ8903336.1 phosphate ABC transporter permease PstA [Methanothrix sp.]